MSPDLLVGLTDLVLVSLVLYRLHRIEEYFVKHERRISTLEGQKMVHHHA